MRTTADSSAGRRSRRAAWELVACLAVALAIVLLVAESARGAGPPPWTGLVANNQYPHDSVATIDPVAETFGTNIDVGGDNVWVGPAPDGLHAYATELYPTHKLVVIDLASDSSVASADTASAPYAAAISPDGRLAYLSESDPTPGQVQPVDLTTDPPTAGTPITLPSGEHPGYVAFAPDGATAYVGVGTGIVPIDVATGTVGSVIATGAGAGFIAVSPDGRTLWVANHDAKTVTKIDAATNATTSIPIAAGHPLGLAVSPDGSRVWVTLQEEHELTWISTADDSVGTALDTGGVEGRGVTVTPDGRTVFVTDGSLNGSGTGSQVTPVDATTSPPTVKPTITGFVDPVWAAMTPDQAPVAGFTVASAPPGSPTGFDASSSQAKSTPIVGYAWDFGDGTGQTTSGPQVTHVYAHAGTYTATVTETDAAGTSTSIVYTGQQVLRNGGPSAQAARSVVVSTGPQPSVRLSAASVDFGAVGIRQASAPQTVTVTNAGSAPLAVGDVALGGADAGQFSLTGDTCAHATVAAGASCTITLRFSPVGAEGPRNARLSIADDASGSPHTVLLAGTGTRHGSIAGVVHDAARRGAPGLAGTRVSACTLGTRAVCRGTTTDRTGAYSVGGLPPDDYQVEVFPPNDDFPGSAVVPVQIGGPTRQDFALRPPQPLGGGLQFASDGGHSSSGSPVSFWTSPSQLVAPVTAPVGAAAGTIGSTIVSYWAGPSGTTTWRLPYGSIEIVYRYDAGGVPRFTAAFQQDDPARAGPGAAGLGTWSVGLQSAAQPDVTDVNTMNVAGTLTPPSGPAVFHGGVRYTVGELSSLMERTGTRARAAQSSVAKCPKHSNFPSHMGLQMVQPPKPAPPATRLEALMQKLQRDRNQQTIDANSLDASARQRASTTDERQIEQDQRDIQAEQQRLQQQAQQQQQQQQQQNQQPQQQTNPYPSGWGPAPVQGPGQQAAPGASIDSSGFTTDGQQYGWDGGSTPTPSSGAQGDAGFKRGGPIAHVADDTGCGCGGSQSTDAYHDPSGVVRTTGRIPVAGARVVLLRSAKRRGPFRAVRDGSRIMSPGNRRNPDRTNALGAFGWDVLTGFYRVTAQHRGCTAVPRGTRAQTRVLAVPPPVLDLGLTLRCPALRRAPSRTALRAHRVAGGFVLLTARVSGGGRRAARRAGVVRFAAGRRRLGIAPVDIRTRTATLTVAAARTRGPLTASYAGNGYLRPSRSRRARAR